MDRKYTRVEAYEVVAGLFGVGLLDVIAALLGLVGRLALRSSFRLKFCLRLRIKSNPLFARIVGVARLVRKSAHRHDAEWVRTLANVGDADGVDEAGEGLLENVLNHLNRCVNTTRIYALHKRRTYINNGHEHVRVHESPNKPEERIQPLHALRRRRAERLSALAVHRHPHPLQLLLNLASRVLRTYPRKRGNRAEHAAPEEELEPGHTVPNCDEEPRERDTGGDGGGGRAQDVLGLGDVHNIDRGRELLQADVADFGNHGRGELRVLLGRVRRCTQGGPRLVAFRVERRVVEDSLVAELCTTPKTHVKTTARKGNRITRTIKLGILDEHVEARRRVLLPAVALLLASVGRFGTRGRLKAVHHFLLLLGARLLLLRRRAIGQGGRRRRQGLVLRFCCTVTCLMRYLNACETSGERTCESAHGRVFAVVVRNGEDRANVKGSCWHAVKLRERVTLAFGLCLAEESPAGAHDAVGSDGLVGPSTSCPP